MRTNLIHRLKIWKKIKKTNKNTDFNPIEIHINNKKINGISNNIKPSHITRDLRVRKALICKIDDNLQELNETINKTSKMELLTFDSLEGKHALWNSTSFLLAYVLENFYGFKLDINNDQIDDGFFYQGEFELTAQEFTFIEEKMVEMVKNKHKFKRLKVNEQDIREIFKYDKNILNHIDQDPQDHYTVYRCGNYVNISKPYHIPNTKMIRAIKLMKIKKSTLNNNIKRVCGISFPTKKLMTNYLRTLNNKKIDQ